MAGADTGISGFDDSAAAARIGNIKSLLDEHEGDEKKKEEDKNSVKEEVEDEEEDEDKRQAKAVDGEKGGGERRWWNRDEKIMTDVRTHNEWILMTKTELQAAVTSLQSIVVDGEVEAIILSL